MNFFAVTNAKTGEICWISYMRQPAIYATRKLAEDDCGSGQVVRQVSVRVLPEPKAVRGILKRGDCDE